MQQPNQMPRMHQIIMQKIQKDVNRISSSESAFSIKGIMKTQVLMTTKLIIKLKRSKR